MLLAEEYAPDLTGMRDKFVQTPLGLLLQGEGSAAMDRLGSDAQARVDQMTSPDTAINAGLDMMGAGLLGTTKNVIGSRNILDDIIDNQSITSADTSINKKLLPAVFNKINLKPGTTNLDYGGGRFDNATKSLAEDGVTNKIFDPYNRTADHNIKVLDELRENPADTATISNVLNVIKERDAQLKVLNNVRNNVKEGGEVYITVYDNPKELAARQTGDDTYQQFKPAKEYLDLVKEVFPNATVKNGMIRATK